VDGFLKALMEKEQENVEFAVSLYEQIAPYIVTDCSVNALSGMLDRYAEFTLKEVVTPAGENIIEDGHYAFYVDEEKLDELIVQIFYVPKN
jgi:hypothetical protein